MVWLHSLCSRAIHDGMEWQKVWLHSLCSKEQINAAMPSKHSKLLYIYSTLLCTKAFLVFQCTGGTAMLGCFAAKPKDREALTPRM